MYDESCDYRGYRCTSRTPDEELPRIRSVNVQPDYPMADRHLGGPRRLTDRRATPFAGALDRPPPGRHDCSVRAGVDRSRTGCASVNPNVGRESGAPLGGGATREPLPVSAGKQAGLQAGRNERKSGHENGVEGCCAGLGRLGSGDRNRGSWENACWAGRFLDDGRLSPGFSVAAPATCPVAL